MKVATFVAATLFIGAAATPIHDRTQLQTDALVADGVSMLEMYVASQPVRECTLKNAAVRREW
jgi:hypothetical protein